MAMAAATQLSLEQIEKYQRDGVILIKHVLSDDQIQAGRAAIDAAVQNPGPQAEFLSDGSTWDDVKESFDGSTVKYATTDDSNPIDKTAPSWTMFQDQFASKRCPEMMEFIRQSPAPQLASQILEATVQKDTTDNIDPSSATLFYDHIIVKKPTPSSKSNSIPWHQDLPYWAVSGTLVSVWMCFDPMPQQSAVEWILGSHRWGLYQPRHFVDASPYHGTEDMMPMPENLDERIAKGDLIATTFDARPGDALLFDARIIHGSPGNAAGCGGEGVGMKAFTENLPATNRIPHRRVAIRFAGSDVKFRNYKDPQTGKTTRETAIPTPDIQHSLKAGDFLSSDASNFPILWPVQETK